jgi:hypothetical protein
VQDSFPAQQPPSRHLDKSPPTRSPPYQTSPPPVTPPKQQDRSTPIPYQAEDITWHSVKTVLEVPKDEVGHPFWTYVLILIGTRAASPSPLLLSLQTSLPASTASRMQPPEHTPGKKWRPSVSRDPLPGRRAVYIVSKVGPNTPGPSHLLTMRRNSRRGAARGGGFRAKHCAYPRS